DRPIRHIFRLLIVLRVHPVDGLEDIPEDECLLPLLELGNVHDQYFTRPNAAHAVAELDDVSRSVGNEETTLPGIDHSAEEPTEPPHRDRLHLSDRERDALLLVEERLLPEEAPPVLSLLPLGFVTAHALDDLSDQTIEGVVSVRDVAEEEV